MTSTVAIAFKHPTDSPEQVKEALWASALTVAARSGRSPIWPPTAHDAHDTRDGFVEHRALFTVKELQ